LIWGALLVLRTMFFRSLWVFLTLAAGGAGQTPILTFNADEGRWATLRNVAGDITLIAETGPGESAVVYHARFGATTLRNPEFYEFGKAWEMTPFFGGYLLDVMNDSNGRFMPNFVRGVGSPAAGRGYVSLPVSEILKTGTSGTLTNTVFGTFVTPTPISGEGEYRIFIRESTLDHPLVNGGSALFRGAAFDGTKWLVTAASAVVPTSGVDHALVSTRSGWLELDTSDFSYGTQTITPAGSFTMSGVWFMALATETLAEVGFSFEFADSYFTARPAPARHTADTDDDQALSLQELLRVIELYNTRFGSTRTGRYLPAGASADGFAPDGSREAAKMALYASYPTADSGRDGVISLAELLRVIELYNTREGSVRTGRYGLDPGTHDGFAPVSGLP
jgi:hypothetical protein